MPSEHIETNGLNHDSQALLFATFPAEDRDFTRQCLRNFIAEMKSHVGAPSYEFIMGRYKYDIFTVDAHSLMGQRTSNHRWIVQQICLRAANSRVPLAGKIIMETENTRRGYLVQGSVLYEEKESKEA